LASTEGIKSSTAKETTHYEHKDAITQRKHKKINKTGFVALWQVSSRSDEACCKL